MTPFRTLGVVWLGAMIGMLYVAVPAWISFANLVWLNVLVFGCGSVLALVRHSAAPSRSIAGVLYDTEHPPRPR